MNQKLYTTFMAVFVLAIIACSDNVAGSSEDPNTVTAKNNQSSSSDVEISSSAIIESSSSIKTLSSSSEKVVLCKVSGGWGCSIGGTGDLWKSGDFKVKTNLYTEDSSKFGKHAGDLFFETDSIIGGETRIIWYHNNSVVPEFGSGSLNALVFLDNGEMVGNPFFDIGFYVAGYDTNDVILSADISNWNGICVLASYGSVVKDDRDAKKIELSLQLDLGDSINKKIGYALPSVKMSPKGESQCYEWKQFQQPEIEKEHEIISGEYAAKHVERIVFHFQSKTTQDTLYFDFLAIGTNRDE